MFVHCRDQGLRRCDSLCRFRGAVNAMTKSAAVELAPYHVRVNAVAPGMTQED
ncbi:MAG: SDR family oxidoreductase [Clostridia bacterium]